MTVNRCALDITLCKSSIIKSDDNSVEFNVDRITESELLIVRELSTNVQRNNIKHPSDRSFRELHLWSTVAVSLIRGRGIRTIDFIHCHSVSTCATSHYCDQIEHRAFYYCIKFCNTIHIICEHRIKLK